MKVFVINIETEEVDGPTIIRVNAGESVREFKIRLAEMLHMDVNIIKVSIKSIETIVFITYFKYLRSFKRITTTNPVYWKKMIFK